MKFQIFNFKNSGNSIINAFPILYINKSDFSLYDGKIVYKMIIVVGSLPNGLIKTLEVFCDKKYYNLFNPQIGGYYVELGKNIQIYLSQDELAKYLIADKYFRDKYTKKKIDITSKNISLSELYEY